MDAADRATIHYTELSSAAPGSRLAEEWETFCRELPKLLADGHEGKHALIKGRAVIGVWGTFDEALAEGRSRFPSQPIAVQPVSEYQPLIRIGYSRVLS